VRFGSSCHKGQKPQAPTPQAPIRNRQTRKVANAKVRNRYTNLTYIMIGLPSIWRLRLFSFGGYGLALAALALSNTSQVGKGEVRHDNVRLGAVRLS